MQSCASFLAPKRQKKLTRDEERNLDIEIGFIEGVVRRDPTYLEALQILGDNYTRRGRFDEGLKVDEQLVRLRPEDALVHYNLACSFALLKRCDLALKTLRRAVELGYRDFRYMREDRDLDTIRHDPRFRQLLREFENR